MPTELSYAETMLNLYEEARLEGARIFDRETLTAHWLAKLQWFTDRLAQNWNTETESKTCLAITV